MVPGTAANRGSGLQDGSFSNFSANSRVSSSIGLRGISAEDGAPVDTGVQRIRCTLANWLRMVLFDAGNHHGQSAHLPAELHVPVLIDQQSRQVVALDDRAAEAELAPYRQFGVKEWKETEAVLAPVRQVVQLPGALRRGVPSALRDLRKDLGELRDDLKGAPMRDEPLKPKDLEAMRRTAAMQRHQFDANPKLREKQRQQILEHYPPLAEGVAAGSYPSHDFDASLMVAEVSGLITASEAAELRRRAGLS